MFVTEFQKEHESFLVHMHSFRHLSFERSTDPKAASRAVDICFQSINHLEYKKEFLGLKVWSTRNFFILESSRNSRVPS